MVAGPPERGVEDAVAEMNRHPRRIVCLTEETTETLYLLGEQDRIVGISGYTVRPPQARREKPKVSAFTSAKLDKIIALKPDLVLGFSDLQADIAADMIRAGLNVHVFNQRTIAGIFDMIALLGRMVGAGDRAAGLIARYEADMAAIRAAAAAWPVRPRVYFEEWDEPMISGIGWVSELIEIAGGIDCFADLAGAAHAKDRIIADAGEVIRRQPDIIVGSWCGKKFRPDKLTERPGWSDLPAVRAGHVHEIKSSEILQPGPAALSDGLAALHRIFRRWIETRQETRQ
jgi:iron complex transport system substrate-binding protein